VSADVSATTHGREWSDRSGGLSPVALLRPDPGLGGHGPRCRSVGGGPFGAGRLRRLAAPPGRRR